MSRTEPFSAPPGLFSSSLPALQVAWDSTSMGVLKTCPRRYYYQYIEQISSPGTNVHLDFGIQYHSTLELFDHQLAAGATYEEAQFAAFDFAWAQKHLDRYQSNQKNRKTLVRTTMWYLEHYKNDPLKTYILANGRAAVELSFRFEHPSLEAPDSPFLICGHLDKLVTISNEPYILDRKTTGAALGRFYYDQWSPSNQMDLYYVAGQVALPVAAAGIVIDAAQIGTEFSRFGRDIIHRTKGSMNEWVQDTDYWLGQATHFAEMGYWPKNTKACYDCGFKELCSASPSNRERLLRAQERSLWNPLKTRGE